MKTPFRSAAPALGCILILASALTQPSMAKDHVLTIGGGYSPSGNQISLERNVLFFRKLLAEQLPAGTPHDVYFSDGNSPNPDLQFEPKDNSLPKPNLLAAALFGSTNHLTLHYRNNELGEVRGPSSPEELEAWFKSSGRQLAAGDRLILYVTSHGGRSSHKENPQNSKIFMWNHQSVEATKLAELIAGLPEGVSVVTVMVQCFSGGFANLIFEQADPAKGQVARNICGFYATVHDRVAAGCTADINEEDYDEYSSHFWAAIRGKTRTEKDVDRPDYDGDGQISFEEAHAFTLLNSQTLDIPVKTSGAFLRHHSKTEDKDKPELALLHPEKSPYFQLLTHARPADLAVLDHLSSRLELSSSNRGEEARKIAEETEAKRKELENQENEKKKAIGSLRNEIGRDLINRWPELTNQFSPGAMALIREDGDEFVKAAEGHPKFAEWTKLNQERNEIESERFQLEKKWAHLKRFSRVLENLALAANLAQLSNPETVERYQRLVAAEAASFVIPPPSAPIEVRAAPQPAEEPTPAPADPAPETQKSQACHGIQRRASSSVLPERPASAILA